MKEGWEYKKFESCLVKVPKQVQVKSKDYKKTGRFPIVSQESELISGYWDDETIVYKHNKPVIIFGDHTKNIKYIDFDFVVGADGTHILSTKDDIIAKYFFYALKSVKLRNLGYARHYKLLKEKYIPVPPLSEQQGIVDYLDSAFAKIDAMKANAEKTLNEAKALFQASLKEMLEPKEGWTYKKLGELASFARGLTYSKNDEVEHSNNIVLRSNNIDLIAGKLDFSELKYLKEDFVIPDDKRLRKGSLFICMSNGSKAHLGKVAYVDKDYSYAFGGFMGQISPNNEINGLYLHYALSSPFYKEYIKSLSEGANINNLKFKDLSEFPIKYPPLSEQQSIVETLDSLKSKVDKLQENYNKISQECDALKQAILRKVFE